MRDQPPSREVHPPPVDDERADPILILGILPRSGTNYLWDLLLLHPSCAPARSPVREDLFLEHSDALVGFVESVRTSWDPRWGTFPDDIGDHLLASLGDGLLAFLSEDPHRRLLTKSPSVRHIDRIFSLFPTSRLLILVRDGRSVVQSCMTTFGWDLERGARAWARAADEIRAFIRDVPREHADRFLLVRYEDLIEDIDGALPKILAFLELDGERFDWDAASQLPVRGSSTYLGAGRDSIHWDPVPRGPDFDPLGRWRSWSREQHRRFEWIAGDQLRRLGYPSEVEPITDPFDVAANVVRDAAWTSRTALKRSTFRARVLIGTATRPARERLGLARKR
jgi:sulfotransferase family protein